MVFGLVICMGLAGQPPACGEAISFQTLEQCECAKQRMAPEMTNDRAYRTVRCTERPGRPTFEVRRPTFGIEGREQ
jgi:hypothetical protein